MRHRCECGRYAVAVGKGGKFRSARSKAGKPSTMDGHDLCMQCYAKLMDRARPKFRRNKGKRGRSGE